MAIMNRKIVSIDPDKCNGCGICVDACHEGAIQMVDGKARLVSDVYCDGLGDCLGPCPTGAISIITREAEEYDEKAVAERTEAAKKSGVHVGCPGTASKTLRGKPSSDDQAEPLPCGCPGTASKTLREKTPAPSHDASLPCGCPGSNVKTLKPAAQEASSCGCSGGWEESTPWNKTQQSTSTKQNVTREPADSLASQLMNWPVKLDLIPARAPYLKGADIVLAADCVPVATPDFHRRYLSKGPVAIACPKLSENEPQIEKIKDIILTARPASLTVVRMEVPCCGGLVKVVEEAVRRSGIDVPVHVEIISAEGQRVK